MSCPGCGGEGTNVIDQEWVLQPGPGATIAARLVPVLHCSECDLDLTGAFETKTTAWFEGLTLEDSDGEVGQQEAQVAAE